MLFIETKKKLQQLLSNRFMKIVYFIRDRFRWQEIATYFYFIFWLRPIIYFLLEKVAISCHRNRSRIKYTICINLFKVLDRKSYINIKICQVVYNFFLTNYRNVFFNYKVVRKVLEHRRLVLHILYCNPYWYFWE